MNEKTQMIKNALILFVITLVAGVLLGFVYQVTAEPRAYQQQLAETLANQEVFPDASSFEDVEADQAAFESAISGDSRYAKVKLLGVKAARDASGNQVGYVLKMSSMGYGDNIVFTMGINSEDVLNGISLISINETPGLGMNAQKVIVPQMQNKDANTLLEVTKDGATSDNQINAISGATITSKAVTNGVNAGFKYYASVLKGA